MCEDSVYQFSADHIIIYDALPDHVLIKGDTVTEKERKKAVGHTLTDRFQSMENLQEAQNVPSINPINLNYYGREQCESGYSFGPFIRTNFVLHFVKSGRGVLRKGDRTYRIGPGQVFLIYPEEETTYKADDRDPWYYMWIGFHGFRSEEFMRRAGLSRKNPVTTCRNVDEIYATMDQLLGYTQLNYVNELLRMSALYRLLALLTENARDSRIPSEDELSADRLYVKAAVNLLINSENKNVKVNDVVKAIGISRSYLTSIFKKEMKVSPQVFLMNFRMETAASLLRSTDRPIGEIAEEIGYADTMSFSKAFKKHYQLTPSQFRELKPELASLTFKGDFTSEHPL